jgi:hypothetical protein
VNTQTGGQFIYSEAGLIKQAILEKALSDMASFDEALKPALDWARKERPQELSEIYPDGKFIRPADGDRRLLSGGGNRHCAEALRSAILFGNNGLSDISFLYEGNSHAEDKT